jgi:hypothetical protein
MKGGFVSKCKRRHQSGRVGMDVARDVTICMWLDFFKLAAIRWPLPPGHL